MDFSFKIIYHNKPGFVIRVALILERRGFEISFLKIDERFSGNLSTMTLKVSGEINKSEQLQKQLSKLIDVIHIENKAVLINQISEEVFN